MITPRSDPNRANAESSEAHWSCSGDSPRRSAVSRPGSSDEREVEGVGGEERRARPRQLMRPGLEGDGFGGEHEDHAGDHRIADVPIRPANDELPGRIPGRGGAVAVARRTRPWTSRRGIEAHHGGRTGPSRTTRRIADGKRSEAREARRVSRVRKPGRSGAGMTISTLTGRIRTALSKSPDHASGP